MRKSTMVELVTELEKLSPSEGKDKMLELAKAGQFHDFKSELACGKMYFVECAEWCKRNMIEADAKIIARLADEIKNGEYDEVADEEDKAEMAGWIDNDKSMNGNQKNKLKEVLGLKNNIKHGPWGKRFF